MLLAYFIFIFTLLDAAAEFFQVFLFFRVHSIYCRTRVVRNSTFVPASASCLDFLPLLSILCFLSLHPAYNCNLCCLFVFIYATTHSAIRADTHAPTDAPTDAASHSTTAPAPDPAQHS